MTPDQERIDALHAAAERLAGPRSGPLSLELRAARGGSAAPVWEAVARWRSPGGRRTLLRFFAKQLSGALTREVDVYLWLECGSLAHLAPRLLGAVDSENVVLLLLEAIRPAARWPWVDERATADVLRVAARLHAGTGAATELPAWDYDAELAQSAAATLDRIEAVRSDPRLGIDAATLRALRRVVRELPSMRAALLAPGRLGPSTIHGDLHPGNVLVRTRSGGSAPVLLDWGRARAGSPLEDVSSFLHTVGCWVPRARVRHDTLLGAYLAERGLERQPSAEVRARLWLAGASNALAGALRFHAVVADAGTSATERLRSVLGARDWLRVIRRAAALWGPAECSRAA